ncbi:Sulfite reductase [NADPH] flavoprotein alpha-component [Xylophilus ampelinus]|nr:Sulfite reductase [NADPH] flavoprotein alpha-component [Xylophilus ampelinus]
MLSEPLRWAAAGASVAAYSALCAGIWWRERKRAAAAAADAAALAGEGDAVLMVHASQTGQAEALAWDSARWLHAGGTPVRVVALNALDATTLGQARRACFIASTYGEGDAPDGASVFVERLMEGPAPPSLKQLSYAVLALGDREYANFCGFGRRLDDWLQAQGAQPAFPRIDVDNGAPGALAEWRRRLRPEASEQDLADAMPTADFAPWRLVAREHLNPGSEGGPVFLLGFMPPPGPDPVWEAGDLVQVAVAADPGRPRDYSIASTVDDGELQLIVRQERHPDGSLGTASGLLTSTLALGDTVAMRLKPHPGFRLSGNEERPLILIGNGTGLAGLRAHLRARMAAGKKPNWLVFGERRAAHDFLCRAELEAWRADGTLARLDMVFSRDAEAAQGERLYVQHRLLQQADEVAAWVDRGAALYVCGSLQGMAAGVDGALRQVLGPDRLAALMAEGRYRRDVY